ncbi:MAG: hypothetical protein J6386_26150 [Candidatus Synoicihabitans palmerolidicus]|nr:hypothetical protein [Candidatus Synoicihabitans palmerolidicus]MCC5023872.1 hypothetical protein [Candidatus Synoicihabitans palmerolidicus]MCC5025210.1 hypothetical protein [Candidatus Synoicihabitans palmerolidicus]MCC5025908.1 hypothetical protein [Candidatus Synoicihabitans palmerolidicus]MCC5025943.1 hypothetical protein [Candidatus Synoicihabitans palmerolidicus]
MKRFPAILAVSLVANLLLAAAWLSAPRPTPSAPPAPATPSVASPRVSPVAPVPESASNPVLAWSDWLTTQASGRSTAEIVAGLRAAGCPLPMRRAIVADLVDQEFAERRAAIRASHPPRRYWELGFRKDAVPMNARHDLVILDIEAHARRRALLGEMRSSRSLQNRLRDFAPTESEYRTLYPLFTAAAKASREY